MKSTHKASPSNRGFALVVTLSLMILLTIIAVGLLTLPGISLRSSSQGEAIATGRANARLALMLALGELQSLSGLDTRITARADILDIDNLPVMGGWKSWEEANHDATGRPISAGNYQSANEERFLRWLTSAEGEDVPNVAMGPGKVALVGDNTVGDSEEQRKLQSHLQPSAIQSAGQRGSFPWRVGTT